MIKKRLFISLIIGLISLFYSCKSDKPNAPLIDQEIRFKVDSLVWSGKLMICDEQLCSPTALPLFYHKRDYKPVWFNDSHINKTGTKAIKTLLSATFHGLSPKDYHLPLIKKEIENINQHSSKQSRNKSLAQIDILITDGLLLYASHLHTGKVDPETWCPEWKAQRKKTGFLLDTLLASAITENRLVKTFDELAPQNSLYQNIKSRRSNNIFLDTTLLNQINVNMERFRWLPSNLGKTHVLVNIADYSLRLMRNGKQEWITRAIVGKKIKNTPIFSDTISYLVLNPYWNIPKSIALESIIPKLKLDTNYRKQSQISVFDNKNNSIPMDSMKWSSNIILKYRYRQDPGDKNPLGRIKFMFPNKYHVYIHDTPSKKLFSKKHRAFSSGCVRIEKPEHLAEKLLNHKEWSVDSITSIMSDTSTILKPVTVKLENPTPVHILYFTLNLGTQKSDSLTIPDLYQQDDQILQGLNERIPVLF